MDALPVTQPTASKHWRRNTWDDTDSEHQFFRL